jgi:hypothetical protein
MPCTCSAYCGPLVSFADVQERCRVSRDLMPHLGLVAQDESGWRSVQRCRECGSLWAQEYPFGESHAGGPPCLYSISTESPTQWLAQSEDITTRIRREKEDRDFFGSLGPESGPELCKWPACKHKRIAYSVMCGGHHFEMVTGRKYAFGGRAI